MIRIDLLFSGIKMLGFDTSPFIYFIEKHPVYLLPMKEIVYRVDSGVFQGWSSVITLTEVLTRPVQLKNSHLENEYRTLLQNSRNFHLVSIDDEVAIQAAELRSRYHLRTPDALQIASVLSVNCQAFLTNDKKLKQIEELEVIILDDLAQ